MVCSPQKKGREAQHQVQLQIIFRGYQTISEILHGFDVGPSAVGFDGANVYFTSLGKFSYERGCTIVDPSRRSTTYELRLVKYFRRGFDLICPHLNMQTLHQLSQHNLICKMYQAIALPKLPFVLTSISGNRIAIERFMMYDSEYNMSQDDNTDVEDDDDKTDPISFGQKFSSALKATGCRATSDYGVSSSGRPRKIKERRIRRRLCSSVRNLKFRRHRRVALSPLRGQTHNSEDDTNRKDHNTEGRLRLCLTNLERLLHNGIAIEDEENDSNQKLKDKQDNKDYKEYKSILGDQIKPEQRLFFWSHHYNVDSWLGNNETPAKPLLSVEMIQQTYKQISDTLLSDNLTESLKTIKRFITVQSTESITDDLTKLISAPLYTRNDQKTNSRTLCLKEYLQKLIDKQTQWTIELYTHLPLQINIPWRMHNPQSQLPLSGSFYPVECSEQEWYGALFSK
jgi:hypothetical protein